VASKHDQLMSWSVTVGTPFNLTLTVNFADRDQSPGQLSRPVGRVQSVGFPWPGNTPLICRLTCGFTSHGFSSVPVSFRAVTGQRRNWQIPGRRFGRCGRCTLLLHARCASRLRRSGRIAPVRWASVRLGRRPANSGRGRIAKKLAPGLEPRRRNGKHRARRSPPGAAHQPPR
jgi:hypothetical protein